MLKTMVTLFRGKAMAAEQDLADRHALLLLDQQMRDAQASLQAARRAFAIALAEDRGELRQASAVVQRIAGLEERARAALAGGREDLAEQAAGVIAELEAERDAGHQAQTLFAAEIKRLGAVVAEAERRYAELHRGRRVARVAEAVRISRRGRIEAAGPEHCTLSEAEATLARLRERQQRAATAEEMLDSIEPATKPATTEDRLAQAGFGPPTRPTAASVLTRLKQASNKPAGE